MNSSELPQHRGRVALDILVIILITVVLGEVVLRVYHHFYPSFVFENEIYNGFRGKPGAYHWDFPLNSKGFNDVEFGPKSPITRRILAVGDSFAFGVVPYQYNYLTLLEQRLQAGGMAVEVLNAGVIKTGPRDYLALLVREGFALQPDAVLLSFFIGNDFDRWEPPKHRYYRFYRYSYVATLLWYTYKVLRYYEGPVLSLRPGKSKYCDDCPNFDPEEYLKIEAQRSIVFMDDDRAFRADVDDALAAMAEIKRLCDEHRVPLFVVIIPDEMQVNIALQKEIMARLRPGTKWDNTQPNRLLGDRLDRLGVPYLDLYPEFAEASKTTVLYRPRDTHWNIAGNRLAAEVIARSLLAQPTPPVR
jgi:hypothetical protein